MSLGKLTNTMSLLGKLETEVEIKTPASKFYELFHKRPHHVSKASSEKVQGCELLEGDWGENGSITHWNYFHDGKVKVTKKVIEAVDEEKNLITFKTIEADFMEHYKTFKATLQAIPKGEGSVVHWTLEYEKLHQNIPDSHTRVLQLCVDISKDIDAYLMEGN